ncbi:hypothetical protein [uncultured Nostoc sp.]|uniref:hypothetical protein n=1 Tax=uncultured Nostoc sp. TaxID=340711 RepID=UPI0035CB8739
MRPFLESDAYGGLHLLAPQFHCTVGLITPAMRTVLHQICNTLFQGSGEVRILLLRVVNGARDI